MPSEPIKVVAALRSSAVAGDPADAVEPLCRVGVGDDGSVHPGGGEEVPEQTRLGPEGGVGVAIDRGAHGEVADAAGHRAQAPSEQVGRRRPRVGLGRVEGHADLQLDAKARVPAPIVR